MSVYLNVPTTFFIFCRLPCVVMVCLSLRRENIHSLTIYVCVTPHVCLIHVCVHGMCYVLPYVWSILVIPYQPVQCPTAIHLPAICHEASWSPWHQPLTSSHIVLWHTSHHVFMPAVAMWPYPSPWPRPHCVPEALSVTKRLLGANPSCHSRQWIIATRLSPFMSYRLPAIHGRPPFTHTHSLPSAQ